jgi:hypothetical protein
MQRGGIQAGAMGIATISRPNDPRAVYTPVAYGVAGAELATPRVLGRHEDRGILPQPPDAWATRWKTALSNDPLQLV